MLTLIVMSSKVRYWQINRMESTPGNKDIWCIFLCTGARKEISNL